MSDAIEPIARHHLPGPRVVLASPGTLIPFERDAETTPGLIEHPDAFGNHFLADSVAGDQSYPVFPHCAPPFEPAYGPCMMLRALLSCIAQVVYRAGRLVPFHRCGTPQPVISENTLREQYSAAGPPSIYPRGAPGELCRRSSRAGRVA